jgi:hypothetical protein
MSTTDFEPLKKAIHIEFNEKEGKEIHDLINYYRILRKQTWREMILEALRDMIAEENMPVAAAITEYIKIMPKGMGRPRTRKVSAAEKQRKANVIKRRWEENRANGLVLSKIDME